jgi:hypothetical protein
MNKEQNRTQTTDIEPVSLRGMLKEFYNRKMLSVIILTWIWVVIIFALGIFSAVRFFHGEQTKDLILYAVLFIVSIQWLALMKIFGWQFIHANSIRRDIKNLELRLTELGQTVKKV